LILRAQVSNVIKDPSNEKFLRIKLTNKHIENKVLTVMGAKAFLMACGFSDAVEQGFLVMQTVDVPALEAALGALRAAVLSKARPFPVMLFTSW
jgi:hypothetical protein